MHVMNYKSMYCIYLNLYQILVITQQKMAIKSSQQKCAHLFVATVFVLGD